MASEHDNPYKRHKVALKGKKMTGEEAHELMKRKATAKRKAPEPKMQDLGMAMKKKRTKRKSKKLKREEPTIGSENVESKRKRKQTPRLKTAKKKSR